MAAPPRVHRHGRRARMKILRASAMASGRCPETGSGSGPRWASIDALLPPLLGTSAASRRCMGNRRLAPGPAAPPPPGLCQFLIFADKGGGGVQHILSYLTKSKNYPKMPRLLLFFSKYDNVSQLYFCIFNGFSYLLCVLECRSGIFFLQIP